MFTTMKRNLIIIALMLLSLPMMAQNRQSQVIDKVVAVVGKNLHLGEIEQVKSVFDTIDVSDLRVLSDGLEVEGTLKKQE